MALSPRQELVVQGGGAVMNPWLGYSTLNIQYYKLAADKLKIEAVFSHFLLSYL